jgi:hypothetical protein
MTRRLFSLFGLAPAVQAQQAVITYSVFPTTATQYVQ